MFTAEYADLGQLNRELTRRLVYGKPDVVNATDTQLLDIMVRADSAVYPGFDLKKVWLTKNRWSSITKGYLDPDRLRAWLETIQDKLTDERKRGILHMRSKEITGYVNETTGREWRRWGSCMLGWSFQARPGYQITLHSRTSYLGYIGQLDLAVTAKLAEKIAQVIGVGVEEISVVWHLGAGQFHAFKSLAWFYQTKADRLILEGERWDMRMDECRKKFPTLWMARRTLNKIKEEDEAGKGYGDHNFNQILRIRRRYHAEVGNGGHEFAHGNLGKVNLRNVKAFEPLPSVPLSALNLKAVL
jgi:hypothetical protein